MSTGIVILIIFLLLIVLAVAGVLIWYFVFRKIGSNGMWTEAAVLSCTLCEFVDTECASDTVSYKIQSFDTQNKLSVFSDEVSSASLHSGTGNSGKNLFPVFSLKQNYPNPFNSSTKIKFEIPVLGITSTGSGLQVKLVVYDVLGREVITLIDAVLKPGSFEIEWNAGDFPSGVYFCRLTAPGLTSTRKMLLLK